MTLGTFAATRVKRLRAHWPALLLPLLAAVTYSLFHSNLSWLLVITTMAMAILIPRFTAKLAPFALFAYGAYGIFLAHALTLWGVPGHVQQVSYGVVRVGPADNAAYVLPQAIVILAAGVWLLAVTGAPAAARCVVRSRSYAAQTASRRRCHPLLLLP